MDDIHESASEAQRPNKRSLERFLEDHDLTFPPQKRPHCSDSLSTYVTDWLSHQTNAPIRRCRSHSPTCRAAHRSPFSPTRSEPILEGRQVMPPPATPPGSDYSGGKQSIGKASSTASKSSTSSRESKAVENPQYRMNNLQKNGVHFLWANEPTPPRVQKLFNRMGTERQSPPPDEETVKEQISRLGRIGAGGDEATVQSFYQTKVFPDPEEESRYQSLHRSQQRQLHKELVPNIGVPSVNQIVAGKPDLLYGYKANGSFLTTTHELAAEKVIPKHGVVNDDQPHLLAFPFFLIEFKGPDGPMWIAENQCLGGSATCCAVAGRLQDLLKDYPTAQVVDDTVFSVAINTDLARLYISWREDDFQFRMQEVKTFAVRDPAHYLLFQRYVRNILDWGQNKRLQQIKNALDIIIDEDRKRTILKRAATLSSDTDSSKRGKPSSVASDTASSRSRRSGDMGPPPAPTITASNSSSRPRSQPLAPTPNTITAPKLSQPGAVSPSQSSSSSGAGGMNVLFPNPAPKAKSSSFISKVKKKFSDK